MLRTATRFIPAILAIILVASYPGLHSMTHAASTSSLYLLYADDDAWYNYDFESLNTASNDVDWAVSLVFYGNANKSKVKAGLSGYYPSSDGGQEYSLTNDGYNASPPEPFQWQSDAGQKSSVNCLTSRDTHYRIYGNSSTSLDALYSMSWGYYVIGTDHYDNQECYPPSTWFGYSENAEAEIASNAANVWGSYNVYQNYMWFYNPEPLRAEGNHIWSNNGYATFIGVP